MTSCHNCKSPRYCQVMGCVGGFPASAKLVALDIPCPYSEAELLEGDRINNLRKQQDPFNQAEADRWIGREPQS